MGWRKHLRVYRGNDSRTLTSTILVLKSFETSLSLNNQDDYFTARTRKVISTEMGSLAFPLDMQAADSVGFNLF
jgi:hypothetical protein